jgi:glycosyltransferase involved in cell wall biosynthesis/phosphatidylglycerophosphate synthase
VYNAALCEALSRIGVVCERVGVDEALGALSAGSSDWYWVDTLYLEALPRLARANVANAPLRLAVHYLPSMVPSRETSPSLRQSERAALETATAFLVTSPYMAEVLRGLGVKTERICVVEPGVALGRIPDERRDRGLEFRAIVVANLQQAKGVRELLASLESCLPHDLPFRLSIVGSSELEPDYARSCRAVAGPGTRLAGRVDFVGSLSHDDVIVEMNRSDVLVSASTTESYGMALAEARAVGLPIVALRGGNVENLVDGAAGGALFDDIDALVTDLIWLASDGKELDRRTALARESRRIRTWDQAADDFKRATVDLDPEAWVLKPVAQPRKPELWETWTSAHSATMIALIGLSWAVHSAWISAVGGAASLLVLIALGRAQWGEGGIIGWANMITLGRLATIVAVATSSVAGPVEALGAVAVLCLDWLDGRVARRRREVTAFGAKFDMETDALFIAVVGAKLAVAGRLGAWILVPGLLRYIYALAIGLVETRGEAPRSRFGRYVFAVQGASLAVALWPIESVFRPLAVGATLLTTYSFARSAYWSLGVARVHSDHRPATG